MERSVAHARLFKLDAAKANAQLAYLTSSPHPFGSARQLEVSDWLSSLLEQAGLTVRRLTFHAGVPNPALNGPAATTIERQGTNIMAMPRLSQPRDCLILLASHYDTKSMPGFAYVGANDSGSSTIGLIHLLAFLAESRLLDSPEFKCSIAGVFFDGEEAVLPNWDDGLSHPAKQQDNTYGSRDFVATLVACPNRRPGALCLVPDVEISSLILFDMVGSPGLKISRDNNSDPALVEAMVQSAAKLNLADHIGKPLTVADDHLPFKHKGIPALDIIDFSHLQFWHRPGDAPHNLSLESIENAMRIGLAVALQQSLSGS